MDTEKRWISSQKTSSGVLSRLETWEGGLANSKIKMHSSNKKYSLFMLSFTVWIKWKNWCYSFDSSLNPRTHIASKLRMSAVAFACRSVTAYINPLTHSHSPLRLGPAALLACGSVHFEKPTRFTKNNKKNQHNSVRERFLAANQHDSPNGATQRSVLICVTKLEQRMTRVQLVSRTAGMKNYQS